MKTKLFFAILVIVAILFQHIRHCDEVDRLKGEINRLGVELAHADIPLQTTTIHDSIPVVSQTVVEVAPKSMTDALAADKELIKELKLRISQLEAMQTTVVTVRDTVPARHVLEDSIFYYSDKWADLRLTLKDTTFYYNIRDSLTTVVYRQYRHRFLWWRWGTKGYEVKIVNFNPHARVIYNRYIKAGN